jgi:hypothetical protein
LQQNPRTSGAYFAEGFFVIAPSSQGLEPPANPQRLSAVSRLYTLRLVFLDFYFLSIT